MNDNKKHLAVGLFMLVALGAFGWMVLRFDDYSLSTTYRNAKNITVYFDQAPGINVNANVTFCGYSVGRVLSIRPPALLPLLDNPETQAYQIEVILAIKRNQDIPINVLPKVHQKGLGASYIELSCEGEPSLELLANGDILSGIMSQSSEFISELTQNKLDTLIVSLTNLSAAMQRQLDPRSPDEVDNITEGEANVTTAIMRLDRALKNINIYLENQDNINNIQQIFSEFAELGKDARQSLKQLNENSARLSEQSSKLLGQAGDAITSFDQKAGLAAEEIQLMSKKVQLATDTLSITLSHFNEILYKVNQGEGTFAKFIDDPRLYEEFLDSTESLKKSFDQLRLLIIQWSEKGVKIDL